MAEIIKWKTVGGIKAGYDIHTAVALNVETDEIRRIDVRGRWFYCKQCQYDETIGGIVIPEKLRVNTQFLLVLAVGRGCGKWYKLSEADKKREDMRPSVALGVKPYDKILAPLTHDWGMKRSPYKLDEDFFIHECIAKAVIPSEES